jgi:hypothetical protein
MSDDNEINSMTDAMLGGFIKKEEPVKVQYNRTPRQGGGWEDLEDDWVKGGRRSTEGQRTPSSLHTTRKGAGTEAPTRSPYAPLSARSQGQVQGPSLRATLRKLEVNDRDNIDVNGMVEAVRKALLDEFEWQGWLLLGEAEAMMFKSAVKSHLEPVLNQLVTKVVISDIMRDKTKKKIGA